MVAVWGTGASAEEWVRIERWSARCGRKRIKLGGGRRRSHPPIPGRRSRRRRRGDKYPRLGGTKGGDTRGWGEGLRRRRRRRESPWEGAIARWRDRVEYPRARPGAQGLGKVDLVEIVVTSSPVIVGGCPTVATSAAYPHW